MNHALNQRQAAETADTSRQDGACAAWGAPFKPEKCGIKSALARKPKIIGFGKLKKRKNHGRERSRGYRCDSRSTVACSRRSGIGDSVRRLCCDKKAFRAYDVPVHDACLQP
jgi:hypothetical protein